MLTLISSDYSLARGASVIAKVTATNSAGTSDESSEGNGALITTVPEQPTDLAASSPGTTTADFSWTAPTETGGSFITGYKILKENSDSNFAAFGITVAGTATTV
jgi:fibronectin type 3 domain-containing protein